MLNIFYHWSDKKRIDWLLSMLAEQEDTAHLVALVKTEKTKIKFGNLDNNAALTAGKNCISLQRKEDDKFLLSVLAHEMFHLWQEKEGLNFLNKKLLCPLDQAIFTRLYEGAAFAFHLLVVDKLEKKYGWDIPKHFSVEKKPCEGDDAFLRAAFMTFQKSVFASEYDFQTLNMMTLYQKIVISQMESIAAGFSMPFKQELDFKSSLSNTFNIKSACLIKTAAGLHQTVNTLSIDVLKESIEPFVHPQLVPLFKNFKPFPFS